MHPTTKSTYQNYLLDSFHIFIHTSTWSIFDMALLLPIVIEGKFTVLPHKTHLKRIGSDSDDLCQRYLEFRISLTSAICYPIHDEISFPKSFALSNFTHDAAPVIPRHAFTVKPSPCNIPFDITSILECCVSSPGYSVIGRHLTGTLSLVEQKWFVEQFVVVVFVSVCWRIKRSNF